MHKDVWTINYVVFYWALTVTISSFRLLIYLALHTPDM